MTKLKTIIFGKLRLKYKIENKHKLLQKAKQKLKKK